MNTIEKQEVHILFGCADARSWPTSNRCINKTIKIYKEEKGIDIEFHVIRGPGSFMPTDVIMDIKRTIENN